jgi:UDP-glucose 4-epimerase
MYVDDVVQVNISAAQTSTTKGAHNVATGESISIRELAEKIRGITDSRSDIVHIDSRSGDIEHSVADISNIKTVLSYESSVALKQGLERTIGWWQNRYSKL